MEENVQTLPQKPRKEKKHTSIKVNFIYSMLNKVVAVIVPLLITPYLARVLEPDGNGVISFVGSMSSYFILVANIGIETYGQRVISMHRDDKAYLKKFFVEISLLRLFLTAVSLIIYFAIFVGAFHSNTVLYVIFGLSVLAVVFDFSWFFQGVEDFKILAFANVVTRILYIALTFILVKTKADLNMAAGLSVMNTVLPFIISIPFVAKYIGGKIEGKIKPFSHLKECVVYFIPTIAVQIYTVLDKTMIGLITGSDFENGYYEQAEKIIKLPLTVVYTLNVIMRSRISYYYSENETEKIKDLIYKSANFTFGFVLPVMLGIIAVAPKFVPIYLGDGYEKCVLLMYVFSPILLCIGVSNLIGTHYYTPFGKQKTSNNFLIIGAAVNLVLNSFLIYFLQSVGAAIASVCAEACAAVLYLIFARKFISIKKLFKICVKYLIASLIMFACVFVLDWYLPTNVWYLILEICVGIVVYFIALILLRTKFVLDYIKIYKDKIIGKFKKKTAEEEEKMENSTEEEYVTPEQTKKVWAVELEMVKLFISICDKYSLKYVASGGTLLGAIRHNGFIPWDDDVDIMMPREDYEKFLSVAQENLPENFFLQCYKTEKNYPNGHAQIRNSNTTCLTAYGEKDLALGKNCGIFIDIFPYDSVPDDQKKRNKLAKKVRRLKKLCFIKIYKPQTSFIKKVIKGIAVNGYFAFHDLEKTIEKFDLLAKSYKEESHTVALFSYVPGYDKNVWEKEWFDETELHAFENIQIAIPKNYDEVLKREYGDYMQIPKIKSGGNDHGECFFDPDKPYEEYKNQL